MIISATGRPNKKNHEITAPTVRLILATGEQAGVLPRQQALDQAEEAGLDLVEIQPGVEPPVCKILDYGKFRFEQQKKEHETRRRTRQAVVKELQFRPGTEEADYQVKLRHLLEFLAEGGRVRVAIRFRGREMSHKELGEAMAQRIITDTAQAGTTEKPVAFEGRQMVMMISPCRKA